MKNRLVISLLAILALVLGVFAYLMSTGRLTNPKKESQELNQVEKTSGSDEIDDIESDLNDTELDNMDTEMIQIEAELDAAANELK